MARIAFGAMITQASGKQGGAVYSRNRYGSYIRNKSLPVNPQTALQVTVRNHFANVSSSWRSLSAAVRAAFKNYADATPLAGKFGQPEIVTANAMFCRINTLNLLCGIAPVTTAPATNGLPVCSTLSTLHIAAAGDFTCDLDTPIVGATKGMALFLSQGQSPARNFFDGPYHFCNYTAGAVAPGTASLTFTHGMSLTAGQRVFGYVRYYDADGRWSDPYRFSVLVS